jgi:hypothetical protein
MRGCAGGVKSIMFGGAAGRAWEFVQFFAVIAAWVAVPGVLAHIIYRWQLARAKRDPANQHLFTTYADRWDWF